MQQVRRFWFVNERVRQNFEHSKSRQVPPRDVSMFRRITSISVNAFGAPVKCTEAEGMAGAWQVLKELLEFTNAKRAKRPIRISQSAKVRETQIYVVGILRFCMLIILKNCRET